MYRSKGGLDDNIKLTVVLHKTMNLIKLFIMIFIPSYFNLLSASKSSICDTFYLVFLCGIYVPN